MMRDRTRRLELGKIILDVAKYVLTVVVIGGLVSDAVNLRVMALGIALTMVLGGVGFVAIPPEEKSS